MGSSKIVKSFLITAACAAALSFASINSAMGGGKATYDFLGEAPEEPNSTDPVQRAFQERSYASYQERAVLTRQVLADPAKRAAVAPQGIPLLYKELDATDNLAKKSKEPPTFLEASHRNLMVKLYLLQDPPTVAKVKDMLTSTDPAQQLAGQIIDLQSRWLAADGNVAESTKLADELEKLDNAHLDNTQLKMLTNQFAMMNRSPEITARMQKLGGGMQDPMTLGIKKVEADRAARADSGASKQALMLNKPLVLSGKTADGKDFTTADWKGKVVLVDFWATWCGPCVAGLPHVKDLYTKYHAKGLEIIGIDNDTDKDDMQKFVASHDLPWPDLFDPTLDEQHHYSDVTRSCFVYGIPTAFLIDKQGVLRGLCVGPFTLDEQIEKLLAE